MGKRAVIYTRISVRADESVSISRQEKAARDYAGSRGWTVVDEFSDDGVSATHNKPEDRAEWSRLLASPEKFDVVIIWKVDRLARSVLDFLNAHRTLHERGAAVVAVDDPVDMTTAIGRAVATILAVFAEMEAEAIRARVKAARKELIEGGRVAAGMAPYGYENRQIVAGDPKSGFVLAKHPSEALRVQEAVARYMAGESMYQIAQRFNARGVPTKRGRGSWHNSTLQKIFENPVLAGMTPYNPGNVTKERGEAVLRGTDGMPIIRHDLAVLTIADWRTLRERMESRTLRKAHGTNPLLSGLVHCARCDSEPRMYRAGKKGGEEYVGRYKCPLCNAYVSHLEAEVEQQFLDQFGAIQLVDFAQPTETSYDLSDIEREIQNTATEMTVPGADLPSLGARLAALHEVRASAAAEAEAAGTINPFALWLERDTQTIGEAWEADEGYESRRQLLDSLLASVRVLPWAGRGQSLADRVTLVSKQPDWQALWEAAPVDLREPEDPDLA